MAIKIEFDAVNAATHSAGTDLTAEDSEDIKILDVLPQQNSFSGELGVFLDGATKISRVRSIEVAKSAINILKNSWSVSDAVLEHMDNLFDESVNNYVLNLEVENNANIASSVAADEDILHEVHKVLSDFIKSDPETWSPLISSWSLNLLGRLGSKYADRRVVPHSAYLPEVLQLWMTCQPTRTLVDLATQCLSTLINSNPDSCIDALIQTAVQHSPHFDWVVAHIGSCFPMTVITRVLACGLKDYCAHQKADGEGQMNLHKKTVVGILSHLAAHHNHDMQVAIHSAFNESLSESATWEQLATGPFLLHLASMSDVLSDVISSEFVKVVTPETLNAVSMQVEKWKSANIAGSDELAKLVVCMLLRSDGGSQVIGRLLDIMPPSEMNVHAVIRDAAGLVLDLVLAEIQRYVYQREDEMSKMARVPSFEVHLLRFLREHIGDLCKNLSEVENAKSCWIFNLMKLMCIQGEESFTKFILGHMLSGTEDTSRYIAALVQEVQTSQPNVLVAAVSHQMAELRSGRVMNPALLVKNITRLYQMEQIQKQLSDSVVQNLEVLATQLTTASAEYSDALVELISLSVVPEQMSITSLFRVGASAVSYFFCLLSRMEMNPVKKVSMVNVVKSLLVKLCKQTAAQHMVLRMLLEGVLEDKHSKLFEATKYESTPSKFSSADISLLNENIKYMSSVTLPPTHCSVFYSGVIGSGLRVPQKVSMLSKHETLFNKQATLDIIQSCCRLSWRFPLDELPNVYPQSLVSGMKIVALLMVELISPDVMFNGLPWPDEDYQKITIERDLHIKQMFELHPILWDLLHFIATIHPSLCYCSVLLRAIMAVLISYWGNNHEKATVNSPKQLQMTQRLINIMAIGQLLPPPLSFIDEILPLLTPYEAFNLLSNIWQYMRDNVPSPALFSARDQNSGRVWRNFESNENGKLMCDKKYTNRLRFIMLANIEKFGTVYAKFFPIN